MGEGASKVRDQLRSCCNNPDVKQRGPGLGNKEKMGKYKQILHAKTQRGVTDYPRNKSKGWVLIRKGLETLLGIILKPV